MRVTRVHALILLNGLLLMILAGVVFGPSAFAQERRRAEYLAVAGTVKGADAAAVWIVDQTNLDLTVVIWDGNAGNITGLGYRDIANDAATIQRSGRN